MSDLYYGDNLSVLREHLADESVDLIYLDPPFNSKADYSVLFKEPKGGQSEAQIGAFDDTWHWNMVAEEAFDQVMSCGRTDVSEMLRSLHSFLRRNDMMAYLTMMTVRLLELHRVLKSTGSIYLHCDPTASHYLKIIMDAVFGKEFMGNEIIWKRTNAKSNASTRFAKNHDVILRYTKSDKWFWNPQYTPHDPEYLRKFYRFVDEDTGRRYRLSDITNPHKKRPNLTYEFLGVKRVWRWTRDRMQKAYEDGLIIQTKEGGVPAFKRYLDEQEGNALDDVWTDIPPISAQAKERLGYPTQKPLALLERIVTASSQEGDVILDPFCGCGTAVHAAEKLGRKWIGVDITHLAIGLIEKRLKDAFPAIHFRTQGIPQDLASARALARADKYQFQWWAVSLVDAMPYQDKKKGADGGIDGLLYFRSGKRTIERIVVSVKGGENVGMGMVRDLAHVIERERAKMGIFITLAPPTAPMITEAAGMGFYELGGRKYPKLQILTIQSLFEGAKPNIPSTGVSPFRTAVFEEAENGALL